MILLTLTETSFYISVSGTLSLGSFYWIYSMIKVNIHDVFIHDIPSCPGLSVLPLGPCLHTQSPWAGHFLFISAQTKSLEQKGLGFCDAFTALCSNTVLLVPGHFEFTFQQFMIGVQSSLIMFPVNILIVSIFRYTRPRNQPCCSRKTRKTRKPNQNTAASERLTQVWLQVLIRFISFIINTFLLL